MATIQINVNMKKNNAGEPGFQVLGEKDYELSRVPEIGELISLGVNDVSGRSLDLRVLLVLHLVADPKHRCDAMVYAERIKIADPIMAAVKASAPAESAEIEAAEDA